MEILGVGKTKTLVSQKNLRKKIQKNNQTEQYQVQHIHLPSLTTTVIVELKWLECLKYQVPSNRNFEAQLQPQLFPQQKELLWSEKKELV